MIFAKLRYLSRLLKSFAHKTMTKKRLADLRKPHEKHEERPIDHGTLLYA